MTDNIDINSLIINIADKGSNCDNGIYIGRGSNYGNPFATKPSKYSGEIYKLKDSLEKYTEEILPKLNLDSIIEELKEKKEITLSCFCTNKVLKANTRTYHIGCHGELIAMEIFNRIKQENNLNIDNVDNKIMNIDNVEEKIIDSFRNDYSFLSNMETVRIEYEDIIYSSVENFYVSQKFNREQYFNTDENDIKIRKHIASLKAKEAKMFGKSQSKNIRLNFHKEKLAIMEFALRQKFNQEPFKSKLLNTNNSKLIEGNNWNDTFWGVCNGKGINHLGLILMKLRNELKEKNKLDFIPLQMLIHQHLQKDLVTVYINSNTNSLSKEVKESLDKIIQQNFIIILNKDSIIYDAIIDYLYIKKYDNYTIDEHLNYNYQLIIFDENLEKNENLTNENLANDNINKDFNISNIIKNSLEKNIPTKLFSIKENKYIDLSQFNLKQTNIKQINLKDEDKKVKKKVIK